MMFTQARNVDVTDQNHLIVVFGEHGIVDDVWRICRVELIGQDGSLPAKRSS